MALAGGAATKAKLREDFTPAPGLLAESTGASANANVVLALAEAAVAVVPVGLNTPGAAVAGKGDAEAADVVGILAGMGGNADEVPIWAGAGAGLAACKGLTLRGKW